MNLALFGNQAHKEFLGWLEAWQASLSTTYSYYIVCSTYTAVQKQEWNGAWLNALPFDEFFPCVALAWRVPLAWRGIVCWGSRAHQRQLLFRVGSIGCPVCTVNSVSVHKKRYIRNYTQILENLRNTIQAFLYNCGFDFCNFRFTVVYNSLLFSSSLVLLSNLHLRGFCFRGFSFVSPHLHRKSRNATSVFFWSKKRICQCPRK